MSSLPTQIRAWATALGLSKIGFARPDTAVAGARHQRWIESGQHGEMAYLARRLEERADPALLLPGLTTAIVVSQYYWDRGGSVADDLAQPQRGTIARYARGADYHDILTQKLHQLAEQIRNATLDTATKVYVDTGPLLEKNLAAQAGIGWQGKHTNLVDPNGGNWFFLGVILTDLMLPSSAYAAPIADHCGSCTACLDACPTGAFPAPYQLDATRCISYLNIELKGPIAAEFRPLMGNRIFGCDDCLGVCPFNRFTPQADAPRINDDCNELGKPIFSPHDPYAPRPITDGPALIELMALTPEQFSRHFKRTPLFRSKRRALLRNVAVALGNWGHPDAVPVLTNALNDPEPLIRGHAAWALGQIGHAGNVLKNAQQTESDPWVQAEIAAALPDSQC